MKNLLVLLFYLAFLNTAMPSARAAFYERGRQMMICHRTANRDVPENTLESLEESALLGADIVEIDIRRTLDGELVLLHDGPIDRVSYGSGDVEEMLSAEFALYDAGSWMNSRFSGLRHPRLDEALRLSRRLGLKRNLDLKSKGVTQQVYDMVKEEGMLDQVRFGGNAREIETIDPTMNLQQTTAWKPGMTSEEVSELQSQGLFVIATFSANPHELDLPMMREAIAAGVDAINTDHPRLAAAALIQSESSTRWLHDELERYSDDFSNFVSYIAAFQLWDRGDHERLVKDLTASHPFIRDRVQWTLTKSGPEAATAVRRALHSSDRDTRLRAAQTLAWIGDLQALPRLEKLQEQSDPDAGHYAWAIAKIKQVSQITATPSNR